jgi:hypothetical protein
MQRKRKKMDKDKFKFWELIKCISYSLVKSLCGLKGLCIITPREHGLENKGKIFPVPYKSINEGVVLRGLPCLMSSQ